MYRLRKACLGLATLLALMVSAAVPTMAHAHPSGNVRTVSHRVYYVYVRDCPQSPWIYLGNTYDYNRAAQCVSYVRALGYEAFVR